MTDTVPPAIVAPMTLILRGTIWYIKRRVPQRFALVEPRPSVWISLKTDSRSEADRRAEAAWKEALAGWEAALVVATGDGESRYIAAQTVAKQRGFTFLPVEQVAALPIDDMVQRIEATLNPAGDKIEPHLAAGILGTAQKPKITLSKALETYWQYSGDKIRGKSADQVRRWENPRKKAFANLIAVIGDKHLDQITGDDMLQFSDWWWDKITREDLTPNSGNKDFTHIGSTLRLVVKKKRLGLILPLDGLRFAEGEKGTRAPFGEDWIRDRIMAPGALAGLNTEARCIVLGMINTGYRPSEAQGLSKDHIRLDANVPHISIEPDGRTLKTAASRRIIPLAGISLEAFRACPDGFPRYRNKPGLSDTVNKFLRENGLLPSKKHTLYGLRHSFEDRLLDRDVDERIRRDLRGHALARERYGKGASLEKLAEVVQSVAL